MPGDASGPSAQGHRAMRHPLAAAAKGPVAHGDDGGAPLAMAPHPASASLDGRANGRRSRFACRRLGERRAERRAERRMASEMSLTSVKISEEVWLTCLSPTALTTEKEEVMGLLLSDIEGRHDRLDMGAAPQMRWRAEEGLRRGQPRAARRRVGAGRDILLFRFQLPFLELIAWCCVEKHGVGFGCVGLNFSSHKMTATIGKTARIFIYNYNKGLHNSLERCIPDVRTQAMFQLLDSGFVGLIFSCFSGEDAQKVGKIQVIAFQSQGGHQHIVTPLAIAPVIDLESSWSSSDNVSPSIEGIEQDTGDSRFSKNLWIRDFILILTPIIRRSINLEKTAIVAYDPDNIHEASIDPYDSDMTPSIQEALHWSNMDVSFFANSGAEYVRKEVPLHILPIRNMLKLDTALTSYCDMQHVLFEEEKSAYNQAMQQNIW
ncbi:hypothetical protein EJB05_27217, partial [Eragrostis curvula]